MRTGLVNFILFFFISTTTLAEGTNKEVSLKTLLDFQFQDQNQKALISNQVTDQSQQLAPTQSLWLTDISSTLELQNNITEKFTGQNDNVTDSLPFEASVRQRTPYGLSFNLDYYREMGDPSFLNFFNQERYRGFLEFSFLRDPFGKRSREVMKNLNKGVPTFQRKVESDQCRDIALKYNEVLAIQLNIQVLEETLDNSQTILKGLKRAAKSGAVNKTTVSVMAIDVENLKAQKATSESNKLRGLLELQNLSGFTLADQNLKPFSEPNYIKKEDLRSIQVDILKQEIESLKAQIKKVNLDRNHDLSLYTGVESSNFAQNVLNIEGNTDFGFVGIRANLRLSDQEYKNRKERLEAQIAIKENELRIAQGLLKSEHQRFLLTLENFSLSYKRLKSGINDLKKTERRSFKNFRNGKATYNDYLTSRNEIFRYKRSLIEAQENFWTTHFNYEHFKGDTLSLCLKGRNI